MMSRSKNLYLILLLIFTCCLINTPAKSRHSRVKRIIGGYPAQPPPPDDAVVFTRAFGRYSRVQGFRSNRTKVYTFLGLYYAEAPIGENRYARPIYKRLQGDVNAIKHGPPCVQPDPYNPQRIIGDENCLLLNVYTPKMPDESTGLPVFVWIHPGGFRFGSASQYDATPLAQQGVVVVAPNYRLGSLGIIGDGTAQFDGNLALFDMAAALRWVTDYIAYFGGDPKRVTAIGQGSGAASAMYLSMSKSARSAGEISSVVAMSGTALSEYAKDKEPLQSVTEIAEINGCKHSNELEIVKCLRMKTASEIIENDSKVQTERLAGRGIVQALSGGVSFQPHVEGENDYRGLPRLIENDAEQQISEGKFKPVPLLTGTLKFETANALTSGAIEKVNESLDKHLNYLMGTLKTGTTALTSSLNNFLKLPDALNPNEILTKIVGYTTDLVFNLPAVLTTQMWSKLAPAFMYSFEYNGTKSRGINFLRGLPIVENDDAYNTQKPAHGDELGYMFDANDIFGNPLLETRLTEANDLKTRKSLVEMLVKFTSFDKNAKQSGNLFQKITGKNTPYIKVDGELVGGQDFPFCGLSAMGQTPNICSGLNSFLTPVTDILTDIGGSLGDVSKISDPIGNVGGILGVGSKSNAANRNNNNNKSSYDVFGFTKLG